MSIELTEKQTGVIDFGIADKTIAELKERLTGLTATDSASYNELTKAIAEVREIRTGVEKDRKGLKKWALEWGRKVDAEAKRVTAMLLEVETPLKAEKERFDNAKELERKAKEEARERERLAKEAAEREAREKAEAEERERIRKEQQAEQMRLAAEREKLEAERARQAEIQAEQAAKLDAERRELQREREAVEVEKRKQAEAERAKVAEAERVERERNEAEERAERERIAAEQAEARKPDREKLRQFADLLDVVEHPRLETDWAKQVLAKASGDIGCAVSFIREAIDEREAGK